MASTCIATGTIRGEGMRVFYKPEGLELERIIVVVLN
jgi:hypothetical protein